MGIGGLCDDGSTEHLPRLSLPVVSVEVEAEILDSNIDQAQLQRLKNGERPGALCHLFRSDDVKNLLAYTSRTLQQSLG